MRLIDVEAEPSAAGVADADPTKDRGRWFDCCVVKETTGGLRKAQTQNGSK